MCLFVLLFGLSFDRAYAATRTWTGTNSNLWNVDANWGGTKPVAGDDLVFPSSASNKSTSNDIAADTSFNSITFQGTGYTIAGNRFSLPAGGITSNIAGGSNTISANVLLTATTTIAITNFNEQLTLSGIISDGGSGYGINKTLSGTTTFSGANTFTGGLVIKAGMVDGKTSTSALGGTGAGQVFIGDSAGGSNDATLRVETSFANPIVLAANTTGTLKIQHTTGNTLTLSGGVTGTNDLTVEIVSTSNVLFFGTNSLNFTGKLTHIASGSASGALDINTNIGSSVTQVIQNSTTSGLNLRGNNSFTGGLYIKAGAVQGITNSNALGGGGTGTVYLGDSAGGSNDASLAPGSAVSFANPIVLASNTTGVLSITGTIGGTFTGGITGTNNLVINCTGAGASCAGFSGGTIDNTGTITNSSTGIGNGTISVASPIGSHVTSIIENSNWPLNLSGNNSSYAGGVVIKLGTVEVQTSNNALGTGTLTMGNSAGGSSAATLNIKSDGLTIANPIVLAANTTGTLTIKNQGSFGTTFTGGVTGTNNLVLNNTSTSGTKTFTFSTNPINNTGTITNASTGSGGGAITISGGIGSSVTQIIENSTVQSLNITGPITVNSTATTLKNTNASGSFVLGVSGGTTGTGNLITSNNSSVFAGIALSGSDIAHTGTITNSGSGTGSTTITAVIGSAVTGITQNSSTSGLFISGNNSAWGDTNVTSGTMTLSGTTAVSLSGNFSNSGTFTANSSTVTFGTGTHTLSGATTFNNLTLTGNSTVTLPSSVTTTIAGTLSCTGSAGNVITVNASTPTSAATLSKSSGTVNCDYLSLTDNTAAGGATWNAGDHSFKYTNVTGWAGGISLPDAPTGLTPTGGNTQVSLTWSAPSANGGTISDYVVEYKLTSDSGWSIFADGVSSATNATVTGLSNGLSYDFRVSAVSEAGQGSASAVQSATPATTPGAPTIGTATSGNGQATVTFSAPGSDGGSTITTYTVTSSPGGFTGTGASSPIIVTGLTNGTPYTFTVTATNVIGTGPSSDSSNSVTPAAPPGAPTAFSATPSNAQVALLWSAPASDGGAAITDYVVEYKLSSDSSWTTFSDGVSASTGATVTSLSNGSVYDFRVSAVNSAGQGTASDVVSSTPYTVPGAPTSVSATRGNGQVTVSFSAPASNGGSVITGYTVTSNPGSHTGTGASSPITVTGLTNGTPYTFTVAATNAAGTGPDSSDSNSVTPATVPNPPTGLLTTAGNAQVGLSWTAPIDNGGSSVTDYVIEYKLSTDSLWSVFSDGVSAGTTGTVTGLTNGLSYDFQVSAANDVGQGSAGAQASAVPVTVPSAPTIGTATGGNARATVTFSAPADDGGSPITSYVITSSPGNISTTTTTTSGVVLGLNNGTSYTFTVAAVNAVGTGASSAASNSVTPATVPDAPTGVSAVAGNTQATISFSAPGFDGGSAITTYTVTSSPGGFTNAGASSPIIVSGLTNGNSYTFTVTATNNVGEGAASSPSNSVTLSTEPGVPVNLAANVQGSAIGLSWSAPASDGGSSVTDYIVEYQLTTGGVWSVFADGTSNNTTATVTGLSNDTSYDFRVRAVNVIGQGNPSATVTATPGEPAQVIIQGFPDLTVASIGTAVRITNEGSSDYEYQYTWCVTDAADNLCGGGNDIFSSTAAKLIAHGQNFDTTLSSTVLTPGTYWFHARVDYGSQSSEANQSFTAVATFPDPPTGASAVAGNAQATVSFTSPVFNGGSVITGYTVTSNPGGITGTGATSPIVVTGLTNGTAYTFTVTASNSAGTSNASSPSSAVTPATVPNAPTGLNATPGDGQVTLSWTAPNANGSAITDYVVEYKLSPDSSWNIFADGVSTLTTATVTGLVNDVSYDFRVSAVNALGQSDVNATSATTVGSSGGGTPPASSGGHGSSGSRSTVSPQEPPTTQVPSQNTNQNPPTQNIPPTQGPTPTNSPTVPTVRPTAPQKGANEISVVPTSQPVTALAQNTFMSWVEKVGIFAAGIALGFTVAGTSAFFIIRQIMTRRLARRRKI